MYNPNTKIARWPLNIADLQSITGSSNQDIGNAIVTGAPVAQGGNGSINQWARYKPIRDSRYTPLTEQDLANADYGFNLASGGDGAFARGGWANIVAMADRAFRHGRISPLVATRRTSTASLTSPAPPTAQVQTATTATRKHRSIPCRHTSR